MNILYVFFSLNMGGAQKISVGTAIEMKKKGHSVYVASPEGELKKELLKNNIKYLKVNITPNRKTIISFLITFFHLSYIAVKYKIDIIHTIHRWPNFICYFVSFLTNAKLIWTDHSMLTGNKFFTVYKDKVISVSNACKKHLMTYFHIPEEKIEVIYNGILPMQLPNKNEIVSFLNEVGLTEQDRISCTIGRLDEKKGHIYLLKAIPKILSIMPNVHFLFVGTGDLKEKLVEAVNELAISKNVHFLGHRNDIEALISACDVMVLPSLLEGLSLSILEAFALGKPVIATNVGGNRELIREGENGFMVEPKDPEALSEKIIKLLFAKKMSEEMGRKAKSLVTNNFNFNKMINSIETVYREVLADKNN